MYVMVVILNNSKLRWIIIWCVLGGVLGQKGVVAKGQWAVAQIWGWLEPIQIKEHVQDADPSLSTSGIMQIYLSDGTSQYEVIPSWSCNSLWMIQA